MPRIWDKTLHGPTLPPLPGLRPGGGPTLAPGLALAAALAAGIAVAAGPLAGIARAQAVPQPSVASGIAAIGDGQVTAAPDRAVVTLGVQTDGKTAQEAVQANSAATAAVIDAVKGAGVPANQIRTTTFNVMPLTAQPRPGDTAPPQTTGYRVTNTVTVTIDDVGRAGAVLDAGIGAGANVASGLSFGLKDQAALQRQALDLASKAARAKAEAIAGSLGVHLGALRVAQEEGAQAVPLPRALTADGAAPSVPVQPGELTVHARVQVVYDVG
jgi:uncharacterized protein YggE